MSTTHFIDRAPAGTPWAAYTPDLLGLSTATTVDHRLAHKQSDDDVFITDVGRRGEVLAAAGTLPRGHHYFNDSIAPERDALYLAEFMRQGVEVIAHTLLDTPLTSHFVLRTIRVQVVEPAAPGDHAVIAFSREQVRRNAAGAVYGATGPVHCLVGGRLIARYDGMVGFLAPETYRAVRDGADRTGVPLGSVAANVPRNVGRRRPENVFIGRVEGPPREARCLMVPRTHPTFFDRPLDHYPGMAIAEAARQLAVASFAEAAGAPADAVRTGYVGTDFTSFAELRTPPVLRIASWIDLDAGAEITVESRQESRTTATCVFRLAHETGGRAA